MNKRIVILFREEDRRHLPQGYVITYLADIWRKQGLEVEYSFGPKAFIRADLAIVHVDQSVVPQEYFALAARYPRTVNAGIKDIRKSTFSQIRVTKDNDYTGPVIVKSDLNFAGLPEQRRKNIFLEKISKLFAKGFSSPAGYAIYPSLHDVPPVYFDDASMIVEKFLPEEENGRYHVRTFHFLGDQHTCARLSSTNSIVTGSTAQDIVPVDPHPDIIQLKDSMHFDYGKFDYVMHDARPILLDANKTVGAGALKYTPELQELHRIRARGIYSFLG